MINGCVYINEPYMDDDLFNDYYKWYITKAKEYLPYEERKEIIKRIRKKEIARERKLIEDFNNQFE